MRYPAADTSTQLLRWTALAMRVRPARLHPEASRRKPKWRHERNIVRTSEAHIRPAQSDAGDRPIHGRAADDRNDRGTGGGEPAIVAGQSGAGKKCGVLRVVCDLHADSRVPISEPAC